MTKRTLATLKENVNVARLTLARQRERFEKSDLSDPPRYLFSQQTYVIEAQAAYIAALERTLTEREAKS